MHDPDWLILFMYSSYQLGANKMWFMLYMQKIRKQQQINRSIEKSYIY